MARSCVVREVIVTGVPTVIEERKVTRQEPERNIDGHIWDRAGTGLAPFSRMVDRLNLKRELVALQGCARRRSALATNGATRCATRVQGAMVAGQVLARCVSSRSSWVTGDLASAEWRRRGLYQPSIHVNTAIFASALLLQVRRAISSHSSVAKKLSAIALS